MSKPTKKKPANKAKPQKAKSGDEQSTSIFARCSQSFKAAAAEAAKMEGRNPSNYLRRLVESDLKLKQIAFNPEQ